MHSQKGRIPRKLLHTAVIICVAVLCLTFIDLASAKYISQSHADESASMARFSPSLIFDDNINISDIKKPGDSTEQTFTVTNGTDGKISEVAMKYKIIVKTTGNIPLTFTLLDGEETVLETWDCDGISGKQEYKYESPTVFSPGVAQTHDYTIRAQWQSDRNAARFTGMTDAIYISVKWEQVD